MTTNIHPNTSNLLELSFEELTKRKEDVVQNTLQQLDALEKDYFQQMNQLYLVKKKIASGFRETMTSELRQIDAVITMRSSPSTLADHTTMMGNLESFTNTSNLPPPLNPMESAETFTYTDRNHNNSGSQPAGFGSNVQCRALDERDMPELDAIEEKTRENTDDVKDRKDIKDIKSDFNALRQVKCHQCNVVCDSEEVFKVHLLAVHSHACSKPGCFKAFAKKADLIRHQRIHGTYKYLIYFNQFCFVYAFLLHVFLCPDPLAKAFECQTCFKTYSNVAALNRHKRLHDENAQLPTCEFCGKVFTGMCKLKRHRRMHTGEKPYKCRYCNRKFSYHSMRRKHEQKTHGAT